MPDPNLITGNIYRDERGTLAFINDFDMSPVKRFYTISHTNTSTVRAWQGHQLEQKWFVVLEGGFDVALVRPDDWSAPSSNLPVKLYHLSAEKNQILHVPHGFATGFKATVPNSRMVIYSDLKLEDSLNDDFRFDRGLWHQWM